MKIKTITILDGLDINLNDYKEIGNQIKSTLPSKPNYTSNVNEINYNNYNSTKLITSQGLDEHKEIISNLNENDLNNLIKQKKKQSSITFSQRALKKADNLTKFNRKNHSEGNKHITNADL
jgi:hypothetical protein